MHTGFRRIIVSLLACAPLWCASCAVQQQEARLSLARGDAALADHDLDAALAEFQRAVKLDPQLAEGHRKLGQAYKQAGELENAADSLETAVQLDPRDDVAMFDLGEVYRLLNRMAQAIKAYALTCELRPDDFEPRFRLASTYHYSGDLALAIPEYEKALALDPDNALAWSNLGAAHDSLGDGYEAIRAYKRSLECETEQPVVLVNLATVYINQDRLAAARHTLEAAIKMAPDLSVAHERLGYCHWREQHYEEALESYQTAVKYDKKNSRALAGLGVVRMTLYLLDPARVAYRDTAIEAWHRSLEVDPRQPRLRELIEKYRVRPEKPILSVEP